MIKLAPRTIVDLVCLLAKSAFAGIASVEELGIGVLGTVYL